MSGLRSSGRRASPGAASAAASAPAPRGPERRRFRSRVGATPCFRRLCEPSEGRPARGRRPDLRDRASHRVCDPAMAVPDIPALPHASALPSHGQGAVQTRAQGADAERQVGKSLTKNIPYILKNHNARIQDNILLSEHYKTLIYL